MPFKRLLDFIKGKDLLNSANEDALQMLAETKQMYLEAKNAMLEKIGPDFDIYSVDRKVNKSEIDIRKKVLQHLAFTAKQDIVPSLILTNIIIDIERIGDYCKNMFELSEYNPEALRGKYFDDLRGPLDALIGLFDLTYRCLEEGDSSIGIEVMARHGKNIKTFDDIIEELFQDQNLSCKRGITAVLLSRYAKRISAHLSNIASTVVNPYHMIGFHPESEF
jgi:phosphate transport system protein